MDFSKNRCPICLNRFCCMKHKNDHLLKAHPEHIKRPPQDQLLKAFQKKAERIFINAQKYRAQQHKKADEHQNDNERNTNIINNKQTIKREHSQMSEQAVTMSVLVTQTQTRKILVPAHKKDEKSSQKDMTPLGSLAAEDSPCDLTAAKTSTPIVKSHFQLPQVTPRDSWDLSQTSSIATYNTPSDQGSARITTVYETPMMHSQDYSRAVSARCQGLWAKKAQPSPRSIMSKISKYDSSNESGISPLPNSSKGRRVTFSFGSNNSSPLEIVKEGDGCLDDEQKGAEGSTFHYKVTVEGCVETGPQAEQFLDKVNQFTDILLSDNNENDQAEHICKQGVEQSVENTIVLHCSKFRNRRIGLLQRFSGFFRSAWRGIDNGGAGVKRLRSPESDSVELVESDKSLASDALSPHHKRHCHACDLRLNPIKSRRPIADY